MKVDGVIRDFEGDNGAIKIMSRETMEREKRNTNQSNNIQIYDNSSGTVHSEKIVIDPKRMRLEDEISGDTNRMDNAQDIVDQQTAGPKNLLMAQLRTVRFLKKNHQIV